MKHHLVSLLTAGALLHTSHASPARPGDVVANVREEGLTQCTVWSPPRRDNMVLEECRYACRGTKPEPGTSRPSMTCAGRRDAEWAVIDANTKAKVGDCICGRTPLNDMAEKVLEALPAVAEIGCNIMMSSINLLAGAGLSALPGVGQAAGAAVTTAAQAASMIADAVDGDESVDIFSKWLNPCGTSNLPNDMKKVFGTLNSIAAGGLTKGPKGIPRGGSKSPPKKVDPKPPKKDEPKTDEPKKDEPKPPPTAPPKKDEPKKDPPKNDKKPDRKECRRRRQRERPL